MINFTLWTILKPDNWVIALIGTIPCAAIVAKERQHITDEITLGTYDKFINRQNIY